MAMVVLFSTTLDSLLNKLFGFSIYCGGSLIEDQNARVFQDSTGNGDSFLWPRKPETPFEYVSSYQQTHDKVMSIGGLCCANNGFEGLGHTMAMLSAIVPWNSNGSCNTTDLAS